MRAYRYYKFMFPPISWTCVTEIGVYASIDGTGTNLLTGTTVTSSGDYGGNVAANSIDGNTGTSWGSVSYATNNWLAYDLGTAQSFSSFKITANLGGWQAPYSITLYGSDNGSSWSLIAAFPTFVAPPTTTITNVVASIYNISGTSLLDTTSASVRVLVFDWATGTLLHSTTPETDGTFSAVLGSNNDVLVTHIGPSGYQPISDGPITPY